MLFLLISSKTFMAKTFRRRGLLLLMVLALVVTATGSISTTAKAVITEVTCPPGLVPLASTTERNTALARLNFYRARVAADVTSGPAVLPVTENLTLSQNAQNHAFYLYANSDNPTVNPVEENIANPCYTPQGDLGGRYSVIRPGSPWLSDNASNGVVTPTKTIDNFIDGVFDRLFLLNPKLFQVGFGSAITGETRYAVESKTALSTNIYSPIFYPSANQLNVPARASSTEYPNNIFKNSGYPISIQWDTSVSVLGGTYSVFNATTGLALGADDLYVIPPGAVEYDAIPQGNLVSNSLLLVPKLPLLSGNTYTVILTSNSSAGRFDRSWSFTVAGSITTPTTITPGTGTPGTPTLGTPPPIIPTKLPLPPTPTPTPGFPAYPIIPSTPATESGGGYFEIKEAGGTDPAFYRLWRRADDPVKLGRTNSRSWTWGPDQYGIRLLLENYNGTLRLVNYHDKARMEITNPGGDPFAPGYVSNGLLVREMIGGKAQVGDNQFIPRPPAYDITVAGDVAETNITAPTYYSFYNIASLNNDRRVDNQTGQTVVATIARDGTINVNLDTGGYGAINAYYDNTLGHNIPNVFWNFMNQTGTVNVDGNYFNGQVTDWLSTFGLPLTEAYWTQAYVGGVQRDVLVQMFERRVLTYTPSNPDPFKVEMGNVGRHYLKWRYNIDY